MSSNSSPEGRQNSDDNVFTGIRVGRDEACLFDRFLAEHDFSDNTERAMVQDVRKLARWFVEANKEPFVVGRVTTRDIADFRDHLRRDQGQAVATVNRALVTVRRFFAWLLEHDHIRKNPAAKVKELRRTELAPKGLERDEVRKLLREVELRQDIRAAAIFAFFLHTGARVGDVIGLELDDLMITERSGTAVFRHGKGNKQRSCPLPLACRRALLAYLESRPPVSSSTVFVGERGPLGERGVRALCDKYSALIGVKLHPHLLRHTFAHSYLEANPGDLVGLAQILGHSNLNTTKRYVQKTEGQLGEAVEKMGY
jgi:site-specific recombinase XerD